MGKSGEYMTGKDVFVNPDGTVYHLGIKKGDCHNRIVTVGSHDRADKIAELFDKDSITVRLVSARLFKVISGTYKGVGITVIAIGMGACLIDFMVREISFVDERPLAIIRLGTCGILAKGVKPGTLMIADSCSYLQTNYGYFDGCVNDPLNDSPAKGAKPYMLSRPIPCDPALGKCLTQAVEKSAYPYHSGINVSGETFYACQGRNLALFEDHNEEVVGECLGLGAVSMEMESHQLFHIAKRRTVRLATSAVHVGIVNRTTPEIDTNVTADGVTKATEAAARCCLEALIAFAF